MGSDEAWRLTLAEFWKLHDWKTRDKDTPDPMSRADLLDLERKINGRRRASQVFR